MAGWRISRWKSLRSAEQVGMVKAFFIFSFPPTILLSGLSPIQSKDYVKQQLSKVNTHCEHRQNNTMVNMKLESKMQEE